MNFLKCPSCGYEHRLSFSEKGRDEDDFIEINTRHTMTIPNLKQDRDSYYKLIKLYACPRCSVVIMKRMDEIDRRA